MWSPPVLRSTQQGLTATATVRQTPKKKNRNFSFSLNLLLTTKHCKELPCEKSSDPSAKITKNKPVADDNVER